MLDIDKARSSLRMFENKIMESNGQEIIQCNPYLMINIITYVKYLENQVDLNKFTPEEEDKMNILFIKGRFGDIVESVYKSDNYDFGSKKWICKLIKPIKKIPEVEGTLYEIIEALQILKEMKGEKKK